MADQTNAVRVKTTVEVPRERIADLLCCAMEGGIGYWARAIEYRAPAGGGELPRDIGGSWDKGIFVEHIHYPMCQEDGVGLVLADADFARLIEDLDDVDCELSDEEKSARREEYAQDAAFPPTLLDWASLQRGLAVMAEKYPHHFADFIEGAEDAETSDVFVQCAVLGGIVFG
jgi:hypothetical protein